MTASPFPSALLPPSLWPGIPGNVLSESNGPGQGEGGRGVRSAGKRRAPIPAGPLTQRVQATSTGT
jgi:hypothetical protein